MYFEIGALKNFANFTGKIPLLESLFRKVLDIQACIFTKKRLKISNSNNLFEDFSAMPLRWLAWLI